MSEAANPWQTGLYTKLTGDVTLMALVTGIFDHVPQGQAFDYVTIGDDTVIPWETFGNDGEELTVTLHAWSRGRGRKGCKAIMKELKRLLHFGTVTVTGFGVVGIRQEFAETMLDPDGLTYHGVQRFRVLLQKT